jgi:hypothetical protein
VQAERSQRGSGPQRLPWFALRPQSSRDAVVINDGPVQTWWDPAPAPCSACSAQSKICPASLAMGDPAQIAESVLEGSVREVQKGARRSSSSARR